MDLTPRTGDNDPSGAAAPLAPRVRQTRKWMSIGLLLVVVAAGAIVVTKFLTSSLDYYCNVDEVGAAGDPGVASNCELDRQIRIQGRVVQDSVASVNGVTTFDITFNGVTRLVRYDGDPGGSFQECIPVVVRGVMSIDPESGEMVFTGDELEVKHGNDYQAKSEPRPTEAEEKALACEAAASGSNV